MRVRLRLDRLVDHVAKGSLSQNHWAIRLGISRGHWSQILKGKYPFPSARTRERLLEVFELSFDDLFEVETASGGADATFQAALADRYLIEREVGQGGMGTVYRARDLKHNRTVALKLISPEAVSGIGVQQFLSEIRHTARLQHHHILPVYDSGEAAGCPFYVVPYFEEGSLRDFLRANGQLTLDEVRSIARGMGQALQHAHEHQVLHCDIKPENVLLSRHREDVHAYMADFGISRVVHAEFFEWGRRGEIDSSAGTPAYVSPEQASGEPHLLPPSDLYSLACTVFEMLAGRPPFVGANSMETVAQRFVSSPPDVRRFAPHVPPAVSRVLSRAMAVNPAERFRAIDEFQDAFETAAARRRIPGIDAVGVAAGRAVSRVRRLLGIGPSLKRRVFMDRLRQDVAYTMRSLRRRPSLGLVVMLTLALGIGMNTAVFSILYGAILKPPPFGNPDELVQVGRTRPQLPGVLLPISVANYLDLRERVDAFESLEAETGREFLLSDGSGSAERISARAVTPGFLDMLAAGMHAGRTFQPDDAVEGAERVVVLNYAYWEDRWAGDSSVLGSTIVMSEVPHTVIGIAPASFRFGRERVWVPFQWTAEDRDDNRRSNNFLRVYGRLRHDRALPATVASLDQTWRGLGSEHPDQYDESGMRGQLLAEVFVERSRTPMLILTGAAGLVLLVACANVANLMLARAEARQREVAVRAALGAGRGRLLRQLLTESMALASIGGLVGIAVAYVGVDVLLKAFAGSIPRSDYVEISGLVLAFAVGVSVLTGLLVGMVPALQARPDFTALKEGGRGSARRMTFVRKGLVVTEVAMALVLVTGAGLLMKSFWRATHADLGIDAEHVLVANLWLPESRYQEAPSVIEFFGAIEGQLRARPNVLDVGTSSMVPVREFGSNVTTLRAVGNPDVEASFVEIRHVSPTYFAAMGIPVMRGRGFTSTDFILGQPQTKTIINERLAQTLFADRDPLGERLDRGDGLEIVGVVGDVKTFGPDREVRPVFYMPTPVASNLVIRTSGEPLDVVNDLRQVVAGVDPNVPILSTETMDAIVSRSLGARRFQFSLLGIFAAVALLLGAVGIYGVMAYTVEQRTQELGVRLALGATSGSVLQLVLGQGGVLALIGIVVGGASAFGLSRFVANMLYEVSAFDPLTYLGVAVFLAAVALVACYVPARRAATVDPMEALRYE